MADNIDTEQVHRNFVKKYMIQQREKFVEELKRIKAGGKPPPAPEYRNAKGISEAIRNIVVGNARRGELENVHDETH